MQSSIGLQRYREADINSMSREKIVVLLYEKIVSDLREAEAAVASGNRLEMTNRVNHAQRIVAELRGALDHDVGGDISRNLEALYDYLFHEHLQVLVDQDPSHLRNCIAVVQPLLEAWRQIPNGTGDAEASNRSGRKDAGPEPASPSGNQALEPADGTNPARGLSGLLSVSA